MSDAVNTQPEGTPVVPIPDLFDPSEHTVDEVNAHLADADPDERERVLGLEDAPEGKGRTTVVREFPADEPETPADDAGVPETDENGARLSTSSQTFAAAAAAIVEPPAREGVFLTSTERLAAKGESKGHTFAEQAALARDLYGKGPGHKPDEA